MILDVEQCRRRLAVLPVEIFACYTLWDRFADIPVYVGTARNPSRIKSHLQKDDKRQGNLGKLVINQPFYTYVMQRPVGWLGVSFDLYDSHEEARSAEQSRIAEFGLRPFGSLFNRRAGG